MASKADRNEMFLRSHFMEQTPEKHVLSQLVKKSWNFVEHEDSFSSSPEPLFLSRADDINPSY